MVEINKLVRSKRKTLALIVEIDGSLTVRAPMRMKETDIQRFIIEKDDWIKRKQAWVTKDAKSPRLYIDGEKFLFLGKEVLLRIVPGSKPALSMDRVFKLTKPGQSNASSIFEKWYRNQARKIITERVVFFAHKQNLEPEKIRISSARTRWGSCSAKGTLSFTWRLVMAPPDVIDYVVVHELCHLRELNHSRVFWAYVEAVLPDYKRRRTWLKKNGGVLRL